MRARRITALAIGGLAGAAGLYPQAAEATANTVYVSSDTSVCSDTAANAGTSATPFCDIPTALASSTVTTGTTLSLDGFFSGGITIAKSGITLQADSHGAVIDKGDFGVSISQQHDVTVRGIQFEQQTNEAVKADSSSNITLDGLRVYEAQTGVNVPHDATTAQISLKGVTNSLVTDSNLLLGSGMGLIVSGAQGLVLSNDIIAGQSWGGASIADSSAVDVVADTIDGNCHTAIGISGTATDVRIADDIANAQYAGNNCTTTNADTDYAISVASSAAAGTTVGYTIAHGAAPAINWAGTDYADAAHFDAAGHGTADLGDDPGFSDTRPNGVTGLRTTYFLAATSPAIDSANGSARNEPAIDQNGVTRRPDPVAVDANLGTGNPSYADRGALEYLPTPPTNQLQLGADPHISTYLHVKAQLSIDPHWPVANCAFDFCDGDKPSSSSCSAEHTYGAAGNHQVSVTVTDIYGNVWTDTSSISLEAASVQPQFTFTQDSTGVAVHIAGPLDSATITYGDGSAPVTVAVPSEGITLPKHVYPSTGHYTVTVSGTDSLGFTGTTSQGIDVVTYVHPTLRRIQGADRYGTAIEASKAKWAAGSADAVVLASGGDFADALTGVPLAAHVNGPLLLSDPNALSPATTAEITRVLGHGSTKTVYVLGGRHALSDAVTAALPPGVKVVRIGGTDRFDTARKVAAQLGPSNGVIVASGRVFADALAAGQLAVKQGSAILLSDGPDLDPATAAAVAGHSVVTAVGGPAATAVRAHVDLTGKTFTDLHGADRYATAAAVVDQLLGGQTPHSVAFASGSNFPDALSGGAFAAESGQPLLLTDPHQLSPYAAQDLEKWHLFEFNGVISAFGGPAAIDDAVLSAIQSMTSSRPAS